MIKDQRIVSQRFSILLYSQLTSANKSHSGVIKLSYDRPIRVANTSDLICGYSNTCPIMKEEEEMEMAPQMALHVAPHALYI